eukprot:g68477.t1
MPGAASAGAANAPALDLLDASASGAAAPPPPPPPAPTVGAEWRQSFLSARGQWLALLLDAVRFRLRLLRTHPTLLGRGGLCLVAAPRGGEAGTYVLYRSLWAPQDQGPLSAQGGPFCTPRGSREEIRDYGSEGPNLVQFGRERLLNLMQQFRPQPPRNGGQQWPLQELPSLQPAEAGGPDDELNLGDVSPLSSDDESDDQGQAAAGGFAPKSLLDPQPSAVPEQPPTVGPETAEAKAWQQLLALLERWNAQAPALESALLACPQLGALLARELRAQDLHVTFTHKRLRAYRPDQTSLDGPGGLLGRPCVVRNDFILSHHAYVAPQRSNSGLTEGDGWVAVVHMVVGFGAPPPDPPPGPAPPSFL